MMGDGVEQGWLSPFLKDSGMEMDFSATLFTVYGISIALSSWLSGLFSESLGTKLTMVLGTILFIIGTAIFVGFGLPHENYILMLTGYAIRGFGYPLFAYSFLIWISYVCPKQQLGRAMGWFWFVFTGGLNVLGAYYSTWSIPILGYFGTLWSSLFWVVSGTLILFFIKGDDNRNTGDPNQVRPDMLALLNSFKVFLGNKKIFIGGIVRMINTTAQFAFPVFLPIYFVEFGLSLNDWLQIWGTIFLVNILFNLIFGFVGDRFGWKNTVIWFGGVGCFLSTLLFCFSPFLFGADFWIILAFGSLWGACLAGYVPLSALLPSLVNEQKGLAVSVLNLGAGLSVFMGPVLVRCFYSMVGPEGMVLILAFLYLLSAFMAKYLRMEETQSKKKGRREVLLTK
ncbi:alpha-ketoglutarate permease [Indibacter alkaliphilus LW1]|uniref:Alpha-ketoglutarate permease n=2 Tax=Indibacter TaxID=647744 RepID=S2D8T0_INDAL|nr:alpha-ketoglutarate permease [Indibacter alkaliphilus LW1]